jgi:carbon-monoxide dehydrogenase medium subunit
MKARPFAYVRPRSLGEASDFLQNEQGAVALAGGQSLMQSLALRERCADLLVDITQLAELRDIAMTDGMVRIGAGVPMWDIERDPLVAAHARLLVRALVTVGAPGIRSRATLGGSAAWGDPTSQLPATLLALGARFATTERELSATEFFALEPGEALRRGELIVSIAIPSAPAAGVGLRHVRRSHITFPIAGAAVLHDASGTRVALYGAAMRPIVGAADTAPAAADAALALLDPFADERASAAYRARVVPVLVRRALADAGATA